MLEWPGLAQACPAQRSYVAHHLCILRVAPQAVWFSALCPVLCAAVCLQVRLRREKVALSPVYFTALQTQAVQAGPFGGFSLASAPPVKDDEPAMSLGGVFRRRIADDSYSSTARGRTPLAAQPAANDAVAQVQTGDSPRWGYLRLTSFSQNAAEEMKRAIQNLEVSCAGQCHPGSRNCCRCCRVLYCACSCCAT